MRMAAWLGATITIAVGWRLLLVNVVIPRLGMMAACAIILALAGTGLWSFLKGRSETTKKTSIALLAVILFPLLYRIL